MSQTFTDVKVLRSIRGRKSTSSKENNYISSKDEVAFTLVSLLSNKRSTLGSSECWWNLVNLEFS